MHAFIPKSQLDSIWQQYCIYCNTHIQFRTQKLSLGLILGCLKANKPYTSRSRSFRKAGSSYRRSGEDRDRSRSFLYPQLLDHPSLKTVRPPWLLQSLRSRTYVRFRPMRVLPVVNVNVNRESIRVTRRNECVLPPQSVPVSVCGGVEAYNESTPSASDSLGNMIPPADIEDPGNARADLTNASEERNLRYISRHSRVLFERIPGTQGIWRVASSYRLKTTEPTHRRSSLSNAHHKLSAEYRLKRRLRVQNRSAGCVLSVTNISTQHEVPLFLPSNTRYTSFEYFISVWTLPLMYLLALDIQWHLTSIVKGYQ